MENANRPQAKRKDGKEQFSIAFPKQKKGEYTVKKVRAECTYGIKKFQYDKKSKVNYSSCHIITKFMHVLTADQQQKYRNCIKQIIALFMIASDYVSDVTNSILDRTTNMSMSQICQQELVDMTGPPHTTSHYVHPDKEKAIEEHKSRFMRQNLQTACTNH